jgi:hypothetical protein
MEQGAWWGGGREKSVVFREQTVETRLPMSRRTPPQHKASISVPSRFFFFPCFHIMKHDGNTLNVCRRLALVLLVFVFHLYVVLNRPYSGLKSLPWKKLGQSPGAAYRHDDSKVSFYGESFLKPRAGAEGWLISEAGKMHGTTKPTSRRSSPTEELWN